MQIDATLVESIVRAVLEENGTSGQTPPCAVPVGISNRHVHLCRAHMDILFGEGSELEPVKTLMGGQYAAKQQVTVLGPSMRAIENVRVLGPLRGETQVEVSRTDTYLLKVPAPVRPSGNTAGTPGVTLVGPKGSVTLTHGCIIANRHIHMAPADAVRFGVADGDSVQCFMQGERPAVFYGVQIRVDDSFTLEMHIDTDDANAVGMGKNAVAQIRKNNAQG